MPKMTSPEKSASGCFGILFKPAAAMGLALLLLVRPRRKR